MKMHANNKFFNLFYDLSLILIALASLPWLLYQMTVHKKYRHSLALRCGIGYPKIYKKNRFTVWLHAPSLGETKAIVSLVRLIKTQFPDAMLLISSISETGHAEAKRSIPADHHLFLPFDFHWIVSPITKRIQPDLIILSETDYWHNFIKNTKKTGAKLVVVNGKMSERSLKNYKRCPSLAHHLFSPFDLFILQNEQYKERLLQLGVPAHKCIVTGNLKLDNKPPQLSDQEILQWRNLLGISENNPVIVVGSSHYPEEKWILDHIVKKCDNTVKTIIVPRHPERFNEVAQLLESERIPYIRYSDLKQNKENKRDCSIILMDAMGMLMQCYNIATLAIVGGSYVTHVGGHNILEPCIYGIPVLFGPHTYTQNEFVQLALNTGAGKQVSLDHLTDEVNKLLQDKKTREMMGQAGLQLIKNAKGATDKSWKEISALILKGDSNP